MTWAGMAIWGLWKRGAITCTSAARLPRGISSRLYFRKRWVTSRTKSLCNSLTEQPVRNKRTHVRHYAHITELEDRPFPAAGLPPHHRYGRDALHREGREHQQGNGAAGRQVLMQRVLEP